METIKIKYFSDEIEKLRNIAGNSDWIDLRVAENVVMKKGEFKLIRLGVAMELPDMKLMWFHAVQLIKILGLSRLITWE